MLTTAKSQKTPGTPGETPGLCATCQGLSQEAGSSQDTQRKGFPSKLLAFFIEF
jgi:hypothetical protein